MLVERSVSSPSQIHFYPSFSSDISMNSLRQLKSRYAINLQSLTYNHRLTHLNCRYSQPRLTHGDLGRKHTRTKRRTSIPFLDDLKKCQNHQDFLSIFYQYSETGHKHDYASYAGLVYKLAKAREFETIDNLLNFLKASDIKCGEALFIGLIRHYGKAKLIDKALEVFGEMGRSFNCARTVQSFNTILNVLVDNERVSEAVELFDKGGKMGFRLNSVSFNVMIKMWLENGDWENAEKVFDKMLEKEVQPTVVTYNSQIGYLCKRGDVDGAKKLFEDMVKKGNQPNSVTYALLMEGLCSLGKFKEARKIMFDMEYNGCKAELINYGVLMNALAKKGLIDEAKGLLVEMKKRRFKPDVVIYNVLINYLCKEGAISDAYKILVDMQVKGCEPNAASYRMVIDGFCRIGDFMGGLKVLNAMLYSKHLPRIETFHSMVIGLVNNGKLEDAGFVLEEMEKRKMGLNFDSWEILVREFCLDDEVVMGILNDRI